MSDEELIQPNIISGLTYDGTPLIRREALKAAVQIHKGTGKHWVHVLEDAYQYERYLRGKDDDAKEKESPKETTIASKSEEDAS